jgi:hypothetical protein
MQKKSHHTTQGIVLMEAVIAVSVLAIMFAGVLQLFTRSISTLRVANDATVASYLAQDAVEFLYAKRRYNKDVSTDDDGWVKGIIDAGVNCTSDPCGIETSPNVVRDMSGNLTSCGSINNCTLFVRVDGTYTHNSANASSTPFTRTIEVGVIDDDAGTPLALRATTTVSWTAAGGRTEQYVLPITLYAK